MECTYFTYITKSIKRIYKACFSIQMTGNMTDNTILMKGNAF